MTSSWMCNGEISKQYTTSSNSSSIPPNNIVEKKDIEIQISILPYYGLIDTRICTVKKHLNLIKILRKTYCTYQ